MTTSVEAIRAQYRDRHPKLFDDGARMGFRGKPDAGPREKGGYPLGFHQLPLEARNAWWAGWNAGHLERERWEKAR
jgi:hypothetical protein